MGLTFFMLAMLVSCYVLCAALVLFAEQVIRPRGVETADHANLPHPDTVQEISPR
jgi:hypothetical protein